MTVVKKGDWLFDESYNSILDSAPEYKFKQDGIFIPAEEAKLICDAFNKKPIECDSEEELKNIRNAVQSFCKAVMGFNGKKESND